MPCLPHLLEGPEQGIHRVSLSTLDSKRGGKKYETKENPLLFF